MTRQDLIDFCLTFLAAYEDYPFDEPMETATPVMRHNGKLYLNLKRDPFEADFLQQAFKAIIPGWHINKQHWNTAVCDEQCAVPE